MSHASRGIAVAGGIALVIAGGAGGGAGVHRYRSRAREVCVLPDYNYQHLKYAPPAIVVSQSAVLVSRTDAPTTDATGRRLRTFQLATASVQLDHCSISRFSLVIYDDWTWFLSLRADQNPRLPDAIPPAPLIAPTSPLPPTTRQTLQIRRNEFRVAVRGFADYPLRVNDPLSVPARPLLFDLLPEPFWVQNGQPYEFRSRGRLDGRVGDFDAIERVELEFSYR